MQVPWILAQPESLAPADHLSDPTRATEGIDWIEKTAIIRNGLKQMNRPHHLFFVCFSKTNTKNGLAAGLISELIIFTGGSGNKRNGFCQKLSAEKEQTILHFSMLPDVYSWTSLTITTSVTVALQIQWLDESVKLLLVTSVAENSVWIQPGTLQKGSLLLSQGSLALGSVYRVAQCKLALQTLLKCHQGALVVQEEVNYNPKAVLIPPLPPSPSFPSFLCKSTRTWVSDWSQVPPKGNATKFKDFI